uniref:Uncharacterized protein n=1 Tax=Arundo donax TaxID=35708 RepID=A0A0A9HXT3_ARUDO
MRSSPRSTSGAGFPRADTRASLIGGRPLFWRLLVWFVDQNRVFLGSRRCDSGGFTGKF